MNRESVHITWSAPTADAVTLCLDRRVSPGGAALFENPSDAKGWPLVEKLFQVNAVRTVKARENELVLTRAPEADWDTLVPELEKTIQDHYDSDPDSDERIDMSSDMNSIETNEGSLEQKVQKVLDTIINPGIAGHGGSINLLEVKGTQVYLQMAGGCQGCAMAQATMKQGVERILKEHIPEITEVLDQTDHGAGTNPYS